MTDLPKEILDMIFQLLYATFIADEYLGLCDGDFIKVMSVCRQWRTIGMAMFRRQGLTSAMKDPTDREHKIEWEIALRLQHTYANILSMKSSTKLSSEAEARNGWQEVWKAVKNEYPNCGNKKTLWNVKGYSEEEEFDRRVIVSDACCYDSALLDIITGSLQEYPCQRCTNANEAEIMSMSDQQFKALFCIS